MPKKSSQPLTLGVDVGGTKVNTALVDADGNILSEHGYQVSRKKDAEVMVEKLLAFIDEHIERAKEARALGIGVPGQVDSNGTVIFTPNLRWRNFPLKDRLQEELKMPIVVTNDVRGAAVGEWLHGAGRGAGDLVALFIGTGIGGGVVSGGRILTGCGNSGGELGHLTIVEGGRKCHCPNSGCLEAYAGGWAIADRAQEAVRDDPGLGKGLVSIAGTIENITALTVAQAFRQGDEMARRLVQETGEYLSAGAVGIVNAFNPCVLVLGGGVIEGIPELVDIVEAEVRSRALSSATRSLTVARSELGKDAVVVGAAALARYLVTNASRNRGKGPRPKKITQD